jgi:hypothetical protein
MRSADKVFSKVKGRIVYIIQSGQGTVNGAPIPSPYRPVIDRLNQLGEVIWVEGRPANEQAIHIIQGKYFCGVIQVHAAPVDDTQPIGVRCIILGCKPLAEVMLDRLDVVKSGGFWLSDGPAWFVCQNDLRKLICPLLLGSILAKVL